MAVKVYDIIKICCNTNVCTPGEFIKCAYFYDYLRFTQTCLPIYTECLRKEKIGTSSKRCRYKNRA